MKTEQRVSGLNRESIDSRQHGNELFNQLFLMESLILAQDE
ncbi:hypothetical protein ACVLD2_004472, partial [Paenibacillus sp. PvR052]